MSPYDLQFELSDPLIVFSALFLAGGAIVGWVGAVYLFDRTMRKVIDRRKPKDRR